jgi:predicted metal-dependent phosphoesterase TrpH
VRTALKKGLSAIAVADHNTVKGALKTIEEAATTNLVVIPAIELETDAGHIMGLFIEADIKAQNAHEVLDKIKEQDGIVALLHPGRIHKCNVKEITNRIDVIEALNGRTRRSENQKAKDLALQLNKPVIAGSDAHLRFEIGCVRTVFEDTSNTSEDFREHIINCKRMIAGKESLYIVHAFSFATQVAKYALRLV